MLQSKKTESLHIWSCIYHLNMHGRIPSMFSKIQKLIERAEAVSLKISINHSTCQRMSMLVNTDFYLKTDYKSRI